MRYRNHIPNSDSKSFRNCQECKFDFQLVVSEFWIVSVANDEVRIDVKNFHDMYVAVEEIFTADTVLCINFGVDIMC